jgi:hypothetical protein
MAVESHQIQPSLGNSFVNIPIDGPWYNKHLSSTTLMSYNNKRAVDDDLCVVHVTLYLES